MYSRPLTSQIFEPLPFLTTKAASAAYLYVPSTPPGRRLLARASRSVSRADRALVGSDMAYLACIGCKGVPHSGPATETGSCRLRGPGPTCRVRADRGPE